MLWGVATVVFFLAHLSGDPTLLLIAPGATQEQIADLRHEMGYDRPLPVQYVGFLDDAAFHGFGESVRFHQGAAGLVVERMPATLKMAGLSFLIMIAAGVPLGILAALHRNRAMDTVATGVAVAGISMPSFWIGIILILLFAVHWRWFPVSGYSAAAGLVLPSITLAANGVGVVTRMMRNSLIAELGKDYVRTAESKGLSRSQAVVRHVLRNSFVPVLTVIGLQVPLVFGGAIIVEQVFGFPGMARLATTAMLNRDFPVVQAFVFITAAVIVASNFVVDILYSLIDPRVRYG